MAQTLPTLKTTKDTLDIRIGTRFVKGAWSLSPETRPDILTVSALAGKSETVVFISDLGQQSFTIRAGQSVDFNIIKGDVVCWTRVTVVRYVPAAIYDATYRQQNRGKVAASVPEVYELINIVIALTQEGESSDGLVYKASSYWKEVQTAFGSYRNDALVTAINVLIKADNSAYFRLKMNGNAFEFNSQGRIVNRKLYDRTGFSGSVVNDLREFLPELERFAKATKFRAFYRAHRQLYASQCQFFLKDANLGAMRDWLQSRFPSKKAFDFVDVIFSPLVYGNQSTTWFESNGFRTLQPHVNFPYEKDAANLTPPLDAKSLAVSRGKIVFTEMNHGYLSPESDKNSEAILRATDKIEGWLGKGMRGAYSGTAVFDEYMNWALISLWALDTVPYEAERIAAIVAAVMKRREFLRFAEFQPFLIEIYKNRKPGQTISSLYPSIIAWFNQHNH
jgi:hypothetical protein